MELRDIEYFAVIAEHRHLGRAADALGLTHPALSKSLRRLERSVQAKLVQRTAKGIDLTVSGIPAIAHPDLVQQALYADEFAVVAAADHPLAKRSPVALADLVNETWALSAENVVSWRALHRMFEDHRLSPPRVVLESNSTSIRLHAVAHSRLLGFGSKRFTLQAARRLPLTEIAVKEVRWSRVVGVSYRNDGYLSALARHFIELLKTCAASRLDDRGARNEVAPIVRRGGRVT